MKRWLIAFAVLLGLLAPAAGFWQSRDSNYNKSAGTAALSCSYTPVTTGTQGTPYTGATPSASGGTPAYMFSETGSLPSGLTINTSTGVISGTPGSNGSFPSIQVIVTDSLSATANCGAAFTLVISSSSFSGILDIVPTATVGWGLRAPSAAYAVLQGKLANICTPSDAVCADVNSDTSGNFNLAGTPSLTCNNSGSICTIKTLYDLSGHTNCQSAACDISQTTIALRPTLVVPGAANGCTTTSNFCMAWTTSQVLLNSNLGLTAPISQPYSASAVGIRTSGTTFADLTSSGTPGTVQLGFGNSASTAFIFAGSVATKTTVPDNAYHALNTVFNGASSVIAADGSSSTVSAGTNAISSIFCMGTCNNGLTGKSVEAWWFPSDITSSITALNSNMHTYWGF